VDRRDALSRSARRLYGELTDDGVILDTDEGALGVVLDELDYSRRPRVFEQRAPLYGAFVLPDDRSLVGVGELVDLVDLDHLPLATARRFSDGRSTYLVRQFDGSLQLACFRRSVQYEADMVEIQDNTGAFIVQRTVMGVVRLFTATGTVEWAGYRWSTRPSASVQYSLLRPRLPSVPGPVLGGLLKLSLHWLSPGRVGATLVVHPGSGSGGLAGAGPSVLDGAGPNGLDIEHSITAPPLSVTARHHYPALYAALSQTDLAVLIDPDGTVKRVGVGLRSSTAAEDAVDDARGMRHRSAARYTFDHPDAVAVVVSEDGPVTVFHAGRALSECAASAA
jgi:DisA bacterial checkpoint controller nucleotide-binding